MLYCPGECGLVRCEGIGEQGSAPKELLATMIIRFGTIPLLGFL